MNGNALVAKARGAGVRTIPARLDRPESTTVTARRWRRHAKSPCRRRVDRVLAIDRELLGKPAPQATTLGTP